MTGIGAEYLREGYLMMDEFGFKLPDAGERDKVTNRVLKALGGSAAANDIAAAFLSFFISRRLYETEGGRAGARVLLSDYFISAAVKLLLPLENERLMDEMPALLKKKAAGGAVLLEKFDLDEYLLVIDRICGAYPGQGA